MAPNGKGRPTERLSCLLALAFFWRPRSPSKVAKQSSLLLSLLSFLLHGILQFPPSPVISKIRELQSRKLICAVKNASLYLQRSAKVIAPGCVNAAGKVRQKGYARAALKFNIPGAPALAEFCISTYSVAMERDEQALQCAVTCHTPLRPIDPGNTDEGKYRKKEGVGPPIEKPSASCGPCQKGQEIASLFMPYSFPAPRFSCCCTSCI